MSADSENKTGNKTGIRILPDGSSADLKYLDQRRAGSENLKPDYTEIHLVCVAKGSGDPNRISYGKPTGDGFKYVLLHGLGPGTLPKDAGIIKLECYDNGMTFAYLDRVLSAAELAEYGIPSEIENSYYEKLVNS